MILGLNCFDLIRVCLLLFPIFFITRSERRITVKLLSVILVEIIIKERAKRFMKFFTSKKRRGKDFKCFYDKEF